MNVANVYLREIYSVNCNVANVRTFRDDDLTISLRLRRREKVKEIFEMTRDPQESYAVLDEEEGTVVDLLKVACTELFPRFVEAGPSRCAHYVSSVLMTKMFSSSPRRRPRNRFPKNGNSLLS